MRLVRPGRAVRLEPPVAVLPRDRRSHSGTTRSTPYGARPPPPSLWIGAAAGRAGRHGGIVNCPLPPGSGSAEFRSAWRETLLPAVCSFAPDAVVAWALPPGAPRPSVGSLGDPRPGYRSSSARASTRTRRTRSRASRATTTILRGCNAAGRVVRPPVASAPVHDVPINR